MDEKLVKKKGTFLYRGAITVANGHYSMDASDIRRFNYSHEYWMDGQKFYVSGDYPFMIEVRTEAQCFCGEYELGGKHAAIDKIIKAFKVKLEKSGHTISEVISIKEKTITQIETWKISMLGI